MTLVAPIALHTHWRITAVALSTLEDLTDHGVELATDRHGLGVEQHVKVAMVHQAGFEPCRKRTGKAEDGSHGATSVVVLHFMLRRVVRNPRKWPVNAGKKSKQDSPQPHTHQFFRLNPADRRVTVAPMPYRPDAWIAA